MLRLRMIVALLVVPGILAGCGAPTGSPPILSEEYDGALPVMVQLIVGTFELDGTDLAVTSEQATGLLPLWKAVRSLTASDTAAEAEVEAVVEQIESALSDEQLQAIADMQLTQEDLFGVIQELGILPQAAGEGGEQTGPGPGAFVFGFPDGGAPGGGPPGGGFITGGPGGGEFAQNLDPDQIATIQAGRGSGLGARAGQFLIEPLIELLQNKVD